MEILRNNDVVENTTEAEAKVAKSPAGAAVAASAKPGVSVITDLRPAVKNDKRVNIFVDDKFAFSLDVSQVVDFKLKRGQEITEAVLIKYRKASNFGKLYQRTLEWVLSRPRSVRETRDYLKKKQFQKPEYEISNEDIEAVIARLEDKKYLDDAKFTEYFVENRFQKKGISKKRLVLELKQKGIAEAAIDQALSTIGRSDTEEIQKIIAKKRNRYDDDKLIQYLVRQGFDYELARSSVSETD